MRIILTLVLALAGGAMADPVVLQGDYQVLQRGADGTATAAVSCGAQPAGATVKHTVYHHGVVVQSGEAKDLQPGGTVQINGLKTGGPYRIDVVLANDDGTETLLKRFDGVLVGDLWVLAGQSNMQGAAPIKEKQPPNPLVNMLGMDNVWKPAVPPTHRLVESDARVMKDLLMNRGGFKTEEDILKTREEVRARGEFWGGAGCDTFFAGWLARESGVPQGVIPTAFGGTSLGEWDPALLPRGEASLYGNMIQQIGRAGGRVRGMLWYQGESDASSTDPAVHGTYFDRFKAFAEATRRDSGNPDMVFITAQLGRVMIMPQELGPMWGGVRNQQRRLAAEVPGVRMVPTIDLPLSDIIHIGWEGHKILGMRMARIALPLVRDGAEPRRGIEVASAAFADEGRGTILVDFDNVAGALRADGLPRGFTMIKKEGDPEFDWFFDIAFDPEKPNRVILRCAPVEPGAQVSYAQGLNPVANITDGDGMGLPSFGPIPVAPAPAAK